MSSEHIHPPQHSPDATARNETVAFEPVAFKPVDPYGELPARPRRRLLAPTPLTLLAMLLLALGFIGGAEVERNQTSSSGTASGRAFRRAARFSARAGRGGERLSAGLRRSRVKGASASSRATGFAAGSVTAGEVSYIKGNTLYVADSSGNTIKVIASPASKITRSVATKVAAIRPGETVLVRGSASSSGAVTATSISVGTLASGRSVLFGANGSTAAGSSRLGRERSGGGAR